MKKLNNFPHSILFVTLLVAFLMVSPALAQSNSALVLRLSRDFGFSSGTGQIQGTFTIHVTGPANLTRVDFLIDGQQIGAVTRAPFNLQFTTSSFSLGSHTISAVGYTSDGQELHSPVVTAEFVSAEYGISICRQDSNPNPGYCRFSRVGLCSVPCPDGTRQAKPAAAGRAAQLWLERRRNLPKMRAPVLFQPFSAKPAYVQVRPLSFLR